MEATEVIEMWHQRSKRLLDVALDSRKPDRYRYRALVLCVLMNQRVGIFVTLYNNTAIIFTEDLPTGGCSYQNKTNNEYIIPSYLKN